MTQRFCKDCKHCRPGYKWDWLLAPVIGWFVFICDILSGGPMADARCAISPIPPDFNKVTGKNRSDRYVKCDAERGSGAATGACGPNATHFEAK